MNAFYASVKFDAFMRFRCFSKPEEISRKLQLQTIQFSGGRAPNDGQMKTRFTDEQIIQMIKEQEAGEKTADVGSGYKH